MVAMNTTDFVKAANASIRRERIPLKGRRGIRNTSRIYRRRSRKFCIK